MARYTGRRTAALQLRLESELKAELVQLAISELCTTGEMARRLLRLGWAAHRERPAYARKSRRLNVYANTQDDASPSAQTPA